MTKANALDGEVTKAAEKVKDDTKEKKALKAKALTAVEHRATVAKVSGALNSLAEAQKKDTDAGDDDSDDKDPKDTKLKEKDDESSGGSAAGIIIGVIAAVGALGGVGYCYYKKKCCFAPKEEEEGAKEGGQTDRKLYKKEVKSSNAHKRHAKEALIPAFKVADEQA